ncbi:MAG: porin, partial [Quisquiliibacterium sp.]
VVNLTYSNGPVTLQYLKANGAKAVVGGDGSVDAAETSIAAAYDLKVAKLMANVVKRKDGTGTIASITAFGAVIPVNAQVTLLAGVAKDSERGGGDDDTTWSLGMNYMLGKNTTLGADIYQAAFSNATTAGNSGGTGFVLRGRYTF